jgi:uncharacterized integral membrane protein
VSEQPQDGRGGTGDRSEGPGSEPADGSERLGPGGRRGASRGGDGAGSASRGSPPRPGDDPADTPGEPDAGGSKPGGSKAGGSKGGGSKGGGSKGGGSKARGSKERSGTSDPEDDGLATAPATPLTQQLGRVFVLLLAILFGVFAVFNSQPVDFSWVFGETQVRPDPTGDGEVGGVPLIVLLVAAFVVGALIGAFTAWQLRRRRRSPHE